jgi:hypothetical protein
LGGHQISIDEDVMNHVPTKEKTIAHKVIPSDFKTESRNEKNRDIRCRIKSGMTNRKEKEIAIVESACVEKKTSAKQTADKPADKGKSS